ncbi:MAG: methanogenesis marker 3 protein, partial [Methanomicrobiaceae archaeon]|nr:methanogenesis marker 3 protein [Methanomicrobiaceae archaeon]
IDVGTAASTEHLLRTLQDGRFVVGRASSTHIRDERRIRTEVPAEYPGSRLAGSVTVRATGRSAGGIYIYTTDLPGSPVHTVVARVTGGVELAALAQEGDLLCIEIEPERFDVVGLPVQEATAAAHERGIELAVDVGADDRVVVDQKPATTLEVLEGGRATLGTKSLEEVIDIRLDDERAPLTCAVFREITGLLEHAVGRIPFFFRFEDVYLFKPSIARGTSINPENTPSGEVPPFTLAMTNDSRKGSGMVGVRTTSSTEFGPTSEPFSGTNIIGSVLHPEKLARLKEGRMVYIREVR